MSVIWHEIERGNRQLQQARCPECNHLAGDWTNSHEFGCAKGLRDVMAMVNVPAQYGTGLQNANVSATREINNSVTVARKPRYGLVAVTVIAFAWLAAYVAWLAAYVAWLAWVLQ